MGAIDSSTDNIISLLIVTLQNLLTSILPQFNLSHTGLALASGLAATIVLPIAMYLLSRSAAGCQFDGVIKKLIFCLLAAVASYLICQLSLETMSVNFLILLFNSIIFFLIYYLILLVSRNQEALEIKYIIYK